MKVRSYYSGRDLVKRGPVNLFTKTEDQLRQGKKDLQSIGINLDPIKTSDSALTGPAVGTNGTLGWNLINWLPGTVRQITQIRKVDELAGITTGGSWEDEEIVQKILEATGKAELYGDSTNIPLANYIPDYEPRTIVRFEQGYSTGYLSELRAAKNGDNEAAEKRAAAIESLDVSRNIVGLYGFNNGATRTFGFFNDPNLPAYETLPNGASGSSSWATKTFLEITSDISLMVNRLIISSGGFVDDNTPMTLVIPLGHTTYLSVMNETGTKSVRAWISENFPNLRIVTLIEATGANGGANVAYLYADSIPDSGTDNGSVIEQIVPARLVTIGSEQRVKTFIEDFTNATAGMLVKRPYGIRRFTGL